MQLEKINQVNDIKQLNKKELEELAEEIRRFLIEKISVTGGHLASNLGVVELTMALHLSFDLPKDKIVWDVGHQSYTHKILTGRKDGFDTLRKFGGMSGFPKTKESDCDCFNTGHSSTSISAGLGLAMGRDALGEDNYVISVDRRRRPHRRHGLRGAEQCLPDGDEFYHCAQRQQHVHFGKCGWHVPVFKRSADSHGLHGAEGGHLQFPEQHSCLRGKDGKRHPPDEKQPEAVRHPGYAV